MNSFTIGMKLMEILSKPVNMFFGSDERGFATMLALTIASYASGFPDAATILSVYSSVFAYSGMQKYNSTSNNSSSNQDLEEMQEMMDDALGMAQDFQQDTQEVEKQ